MKKIVFVIAALASVAISCTKEQFSAPVIIDENIAGGRQIVFSTSLPKTTITDAAPSWTEGDSVKIVWAKQTQYLDTLSFEMRDTVIVGSIDAPVDPATGEIKAVVDTARDFYYAVYPHWATTSLKITPDASDSLTVTVRSTSADGSWGRAHYAVAITDESSAHFAFKNISNALKFTVTTPGVTSVKITTPDGSATAAKARFAFSGDEPGTAVYVTPQLSSTVTIDGPGTYYAPVIYGTEWASGFTIAEFAGEELVCFATTENPVFWNRSYILDAGTIEDHQFVPRDYFFKPTACGKEDGSSWENAAGPAKLCALLSREDGNWYINNQSLFLSEGTYDISIDGESVGFTFKNSTSFNLMGGYPDTAAGTDTTGRDITAYKTLLQTSATCSNARMFYSNSGCKFGNVLFDGLYFGEQEVKKNTRGWVLYINSGCGFTEEYSKVTFNRCVFQNLVSKSDGTAGHYGMVDVNNINATVDFTNCVFKSNTSINSNKKGGAAIVVQGSKVVNIDHCVFEQNKSQYNGGAIALTFDDAGKGYKSTVNVKSSTFTGNQVTDQLGVKEAGCGGALYVLGISGQAVNNEVNVNDCTFTENKTKGTGGAISFRYVVDLNVNNCTFENNVAEGYYSKSGTATVGSNAGGGAIASVVNMTSSSPTAYNNTGTVRISNSTFNGNSGRRGGAIQIGGSLTYIDACSFIGNNAPGNGGGAIFLNSNAHYISNSIFRNNVTAKSGGGAYAAKSTSGKACFANCLFTGNTSSADKTSQAIANFDSSDATTGSYFNFFGCTFFNNGADQTVSSQKLGGVTFTNCTLAETGKAEKSVLVATADNTFTLLNSIILSSTGYALSGKKFIDAGANIYGTLSSATMVPVDGAAASVGSVAFADVFGASPALDSENKLTWAGTYTGITPLSAEAVKTSLQAISPETYTWAENLALWFAGETWIPGAWQN